MVAGTPEDWIQWFSQAYVPAGLNHAPLSFTDPFKLKAWASLEVAGLTDLVEQVRFFGEHVSPAAPLIQRARAASGFRFRLYWPFRPTRHTRATDDGV